MYLVGMMLGGLIPTFLLSRLFLWLTKSWDGGLQRLVVIHSVSLGFASLIGGIGMADTGAFAPSRALLTYSVPQLIWFIVDYFRYKKRRNKAADAKGADFGSHLVEKVENFGEERLDTIVVNLLSVFKGQLDKIADNDEHSAEVQAAAELEIFKEQIGEAQQRMWQEVQDHLEPEIRLLGELGGMEAILADLIDSVTEPRLETLIAGAKVNYGSRLQELAEDT